MKRKPDPDRLVEARTPTRLSEVVERRGQTEGNRTSKRSERKTREPRSHRESTPTQASEELDWGLDEHSEQKPKGERQSETKESKRSRKWTPMARAVAMLARREHSKVELISKLMARGVEQEEAERVVQELEELDLQSDQRFLESKVRQRVGNGYGPRRTQMELSGLGLDEAAVEKALENPGDEWIQGAYDLIERRYGTSPLPFELRQKALGLLVRRGFSFEQAQQVIREPRPELDED